MMAAPDATNDDASTLTQPTSPRPMVRAPAVAAVRRGFRMAFSRPSLPDTLVRRTMGHPMAAAMGRATSGMTRNTPRNVRAAPSPTSAIPPSANSPTDSAAAPRATTIPPVIDRRVSEPTCSVAAPVRAAMGGTFDARRAGPRAAKTVTSEPVTIETTIVRGWMIVPVAGRPMPKARRRPCSPIATRMPTPTPIADATTPTTPASTTTEVITCRRLAPSALSRASSRVRWATRIENVLTMMKAPTNREMTAKTSRAVLKMSMKPLTWSAPSSASWSPVTASQPSGSTPSQAAGSASSTRVRSSKADTPSTACMSIVSYWPTLPSTRWAVMVSKAARVAPARLSASPKPAMPTTSYSSGGPWPRMPTRAPTSIFWALAVPASMATSPGPAGALPLRRRSGPRVAFGSS